MHHIFWVFPSPPLVLLLLFQILIISWLGYLDVPLVDLPVLFPYYSTGRIILKNHKRNYVTPMLKTHEWFSITYELFNGDDKKSSYLHNCCENQSINA